MREQVERDANVAGADGRVDPGETGVERRTYMYGSASREPLAKPLIQYSRDATDKETEQLWGGLPGALV